MAKKLRAESIIYGLIAIELFVIFGIYGSSLR